MTPYLLPLTLALTFVTATLSCTARTQDLASNDAERMPASVAVDGQPLGANVERLGQALDYLGAPTLNASDANKTPGTLIPQSDRDSSIPCCPCLRRLLHVRSDLKGLLVDQGMDTVQHDSVKWWTRWRLTRNSSQAEAQVARWKAAWLQGAHAAWHPQNKATNPYDSEVQRAAWRAGAKWAGENPDRRTNRARRFAHPQRRASDAKLATVFKRAVAVTATSLTLYAISKTLWRAKRAPEDAP